MSRRTFIRGLMLSVDAQVDASIAQVIRHVSREAGVSAADILGPIKTWDIAHPRQEVMRIAHRVLGRSLTQIGTVLGGRDHTTILNGIRSAEKRKASQ